MVGEKELVFYPELRRQTAFYDPLSARRKKQQKSKSKTKYRWIWMIKNEDELCWNEFARSAFWFDSYLKCKENALQQDLNTPSCASLRLYIEIENDGFRNVVEVLHRNDPDEEEYFASDEEEDEDDGAVKYRWEWQVNHPADNIWRSYEKPIKWFNNLQECKEDAKNVNTNVVSCAALRLCIQMWHRNECILETYFKEEEL